MNGDAPMNEREKKSGNGGDVHALNEYEPGQAFSGVIGRTPSPVSTCELASASGPGAPLT